ncbi:unnamed protein product [Phytophthora lilii]|uniref:Unnamed protein product n=1 Tax=Phytophthora lilii TaxID=2077276 RepID=A0A9W6TZJ2_9STRA|nr:unnamed protein product [Phytophthora lilii]
MSAKTRAWQAAWCVHVSHLRSNGSLPEDKPRARELIDKIVTAENPDKDKHPQLFETVMTCMLHGPCEDANSSCVCMKDGKCSKGFPKPFSDVTLANLNGYPIYRRRRRPPGVIRFNGKKYDNATINQWVVPYNPYCSEKYNCRINIEVCTDIAAVKYLYKYVYKGSDKAVLTLEAVTDDGQSSRREPNDPALPEYKVHIPSGGVHPAV